MSGQSSNRYLDLTALLFLNRSTLFYWNLSASLIRHFFTFLHGLGLAVLLRDDPAFILISKLTFSLVLHTTFVKLLLLDRKVQ